MDIDDIRADINERMASHIDSRCATADEVTIAWMICEHDRLTSELTSAKEEIERLKEKWERERESVHRFEQAGILLRQRAEAAESALTSERKETERLRGALRYIAEEGDFSAPEGMKYTAKAALQERQGEEQVCEWDGNVAGCGGWQQYQFCPYCRKPLVIKEEAQ